MVSNEIIKTQLVHKNITFAIVEQNLSSGLFTNVIEVLKPDLIPVGVKGDKKGINLDSLNKWFTHRCIPENRKNIKNCLDTLKVDSCSKISMRSFGLSLSDNYWLRPGMSELPWGRMHFYDNFKTDVGDVLFGIPLSLQRIDYMSPDSTTNGCTKKHWIKDKNGIWLQKEDDKLSLINNHIMTQILKSIGVSVCDESIEVIGKIVRQNIKLFTSENEELVDGWQIYHTLEAPKRVNSLSHFRDCCKHLKIKTADQWIDQLLIAAYLSGAKEIDVESCGFLRDGSTLKWTKPAPLFGFGYDLYLDEAGNDKLLKEVVDTSWINFDIDVEGLLETIFMNKKLFKFIGSEYADKVMSVLNERLKKIQKLKKQTITIATKVNLKTTEDKSDSKSTSKKQNQTKESKIKKSDSKEIQQKTEKVAKTSNSTNNSTSKPTIKFSKKSTTTKSTDQKSSISSKPKTDSKNSSKAKSKTETKPTKKTTQTKTKAKIKK